MSRLKPALPAASFSRVAKVGPSTAPSVPVHTTMEIARALRSGRARSHRHVPTDQVGGLAGADQEQADDEERERPDLARGRRQPRTDDGGGVGHDQSGATTPAAHVLRQGHGDQRRARR